MIFPRIFSLFYLRCNKNSTEIDNIRGQKFTIPTGLYHYFVPRKTKQKKKKNHTTIRFYKVKHPLSRQWFTGYGIETGPHAGACKSCRGWYLMKHSCGHRHPWHRLKLRAKNVLEGCGIGTFKRFRGYVVFRLDFSL